MSRVHGQGSQSGTKPCDLCGNPTDAHTFTGLLDLCLDCYERTGKQPARTGDTK